MAVVSPSTFRRTASLFMLVGACAVTYELVTVFAFGWSNDLLFWGGFIVFWMGDLAHLGFNYGQASLTGDNVSTSGRQNPCGVVHSLPCGLDEDCPIPAEYHEAGTPDREIVREARKDRMKR